MTTQDEIIGAIENIILTQVEIRNTSELDAYQEVCEAYDQYCGRDGLQCATRIQDEVSHLLRSVKGANAVERVGDAIAEIGGQY